MVKVLFFRFGFRGIGGRRIAAFFCSGSEKISPFIDGGT
jgi:hypothetical protein